MKKLVFLLMLIAFAVSGCSKKTPPVTTTLGAYTPYQGYMEKMQGKVQSVTEANYWAIADGETYVKGSKMTLKELDSLEYTGDFEARFDEEGDLVSCTWFDENKKVTAKWDITKEAGVMAKAVYTQSDTIRIYHKFKCDMNGEIEETEIFRAAVDTLMRKIVTEKNAKGDTVIYNHFNNKGEMVAKTILTYNDSGQFMGYSAYSPDGSYVGGSELKYGAFIPATEIIFYNKERQATAVNHFTFQFDAKGNWTSVICKDDKGFAIIGERVYTFFE